MTAACAAHVDLSLRQDTEQAFQHMLKQSKTRYQDATMNMVEGFSHIVEFKIGNQDPVSVDLIPDTRLAEITLMSHSCKECKAWGRDEIVWSP